MVPKMPLVMRVYSVCVRVCVDFEQVEMSRDTGRLHEMDPPCPPAPEMQKAMSIAGLWRLQFWAMARLRFLQLRRGKKGLLIL